MLTNDIILAISECDTLKPLGIEFRHFANSVLDTKYHKPNWCSSTHPQWDK